MPWKWLKTTILPFPRKNKTLRRSEIFVYPQSQNPQAIPSAARLRSSQQPHEERGPHHQGLCSLLINSWLLNYRLYQQNQQAVYLTDIICSFD